MIFRHLHFNRFFLQRRNLFPLLDAYIENEAQLRSTEDSRTNSLPLANEERSWDNLRGFFGTHSDKLIFERKEQEWEYAHIINLFNTNGSAVFGFKNKLIEMLSQTDVDGIPIKTLQLPFRTQYFYFEDSEFLPEFSEEYKIDGFYLHADSLEHTLESSIKHGQDLCEIKPYWFSGSDEEWVFSRQKAYDENMASRQRYRQFKENVDCFDYGSDSYTLLCVNFTFSPRGDLIRPLLGQEILSEPILKCYYDFGTHNTTVGEAIEDGFRDGFPTETADEFVEHKNTYLNVINKPEYLGAVTRLVFNLLAYLNWNDRDVVYRHPNKKLQIKIDKAITEKQRKKAISKAESAGFKMVYLCGHETLYPEQLHVTTSSSPRTHWRRGHWRNQRHGENLKNTKLVWIKPTLVSKPLGQDQPVLGHIYVS